MHHIRNIAIILPDTLQSIGLQHILTDYFPPVTVVHYCTFESFTHSNNDNYDYYFTSADSFVLHADYFLPRKNKTMVITNSELLNPPAGNGNGGSHLFIGASSETILEQLQSFFTNENTVTTTGDINKELSVRETDVLQLIVKGITNKEIADKLNISLNTVLTHRKNITSKLGIKTVSGLTFYAIMNGLISGDEIEL